MTNNILIRASDKIVLSCGKVYEITNGTSVVIRHPDTNEIEETSNDPAGFETETTSSLNPSNILEGWTKYESGSFSEITNGPIRKTIKSLSRMYPSIRDESTDADMLAYANVGLEVQIMSLTDFFSICLAAGADTADFKDIWTYDGYRASVTEALLNGEYNRLVAIIATMPWTISANSSAAINVGINSIKISRIDKAMQHIGLSQEDMTNVKSNLVERHMQLL